MSNFDSILRNGLIYDGSGKNPYIGDIAIIGDKIVKIGKIDGTANIEIEINGLSVAPGFINMLSWSVESLIEDGRALGTIKQGVTLEVMGEGWSWGPLNDKMKQEFKEVFSSPIEYDITWDTLGEYLLFLENKGISTNIASFVGATNARMHFLGHEDREPSEEELEKMKSLVEQAMQEGAMGVGSSLIYPPAFYASTNELIELCKVVSKYNGMYISHIRSEGMNFLEALDEFITIVRESKVKGEVYHLKAAGEVNWGKLDLAIAKIEEARAEGLEITTDMYLYTAAGTGLSSTLPPWVEEGGQEKYLARLKDPETREKIKTQMLESTKDWENLYTEAGPENMLLAAFAKDELKHLMGKRVSEVAKSRGQDPRDTIIDLLIQDETRIGTIYFIISEENVKKKIALPFMSFGSDGDSMSAEGIFLENSTHPRAYGNFARLLGKYVRDEKVIPMKEAIRRLTSFPASNLGLKDRGLLKEDFFADIVVFDPENIRDNATYENPHQLSDGMVHVWVNGEQVLENGNHTGNFPGKFVKRQ
ncbi:MAG: D-aminoacylase [Candidatus Heimdallarchaeota archaeon]|nr:D-aminoacylase [Candidatus Heimdallarchaeota archaeon]